MPDLETVIEGVEGEEPRAGDDEEDVGFDPDGQRFDTQADFEEREGDGGPEENDCTIGDQGIRECGE